MKLKQPQDYYNFQHLCGFSLFMREPCIYADETRSLKVINFRNSVVMPVLMASQYHIKFGRTYNSRIFNKQNERKPKQVTK